MRCPPIPASIRTFPEAVSIVNAADVLHVCSCIVRPHQIQPLLQESCLYNSAEILS